MEMIELIPSQWIDIKLLDNNKGQLEGIPANPRKISQKNKRLLKKSITENPEELGVNELHVVRNGERYVVTSGNMRLSVLRELGYEKAPCKILDGWTKENIIADMVKTNVQFGEWDKNIFTDWNVEGFDFGLLEDWGVNIKLDEMEEEESGEMEFSEILNEEHNYLVLYFDNEVDWLQAQTLLNIKQVKCGSTRRDGKLSKKMKRVGVGRVMRGAEVIQKILDQK